jgi:hypothetical protein
MYDFPYFGLVAKGFSNVFGPVSYGSGLGLNKSD